MIGLFRPLRNRLLARYFYLRVFIGNAYKEGELEKESTCKEYLQVQQEGKRKVSRMVKYYDLDVVFSRNENRNLEWYVGFSDMPLFL